MLCFVIWEKLSVVCFLGYFTFWNFYKRTIDFLTSCLTPPHQIVIRDKAALGIYLFHLGVPQKFVLKPFFFLIDINNLSSYVEGRRVLLFADVQTNFNSSLNINRHIHLQIILNKQLHLLKWFESLTLILHKSETNISYLPLRQLSHDIED